MHPEPLLIRAGSALYGTAIAGGLSAAETAVGRSLSSHPEAFAG